MSKFTVYSCDWHRCNAKKEVPPNHKPPQKWLLLHLEREPRFGGPGQVEDATFCSHECAIDWLTKDKEE